MNPRDWCSTLIYKLSSTFGIIYSSQKLRLIKFTISYRTVDWANLVSAAGNPQWNNITHTLQSNILLPYSDNIYHHHTITAKVHKLLSIIQCNAAVNAMHSVIRALNVKWNFWEHRNWLILSDKTNESCRLQLKLNTGYAILIILTTASQLFLTYHLPC